MSKKYVQGILHQLKTKGISKKELQNFDGI